MAVPLPPGTDAGHCQEHIQASRLRMAATDPWSQPRMGLRGEARGAPWACEEQEMRQLWAAPQAFCGHSRRAPFVQGPFSTPAPPPHASGLVSVMQEAGGETGLGLRSGPPWGQDPERGAEHA